MPNPIRLLTLIALPLLALTIAASNASAGTWHEKDGYRYYRDNGNWYWQNHGRWYRWTDQRWQPYSGFSTGNRADRQSYRVYTPSRNQSRSYRDRRFHYYGNESNRWRYRHRQQDIRRGFFMIPNMIGG